MTRRLVTSWMTSRDVKLVMSQVVAFGN